MNQLPPRVWTWGRRVYFAGVVLVLLFVAVMLLGCGNIQCDLLGSDSLRRQCEDQAFAVTIYRVPTWIPPAHGGLY